MRTSKEGEAVEGGTPFGHLVLLVKFYQRKKNADAFRTGQLHTRRLKFFRGLEDPHRGDDDEGRVLLEGGELSMKADDGEWVPIETAGPIRFNYSYLEDLNLFCMTAFQSESFDVPAHETVHQVMEQIGESLPTCREMGEHAVVIWYFKEFIRRVASAAERDGYQYWCELVKYYDSYPHPATLGPEKSVTPAFLKSRKYELQREYRIVLNTRTSGQNPITLDIGDIRDISTYMKTPSLGDLKWRIRKR